MSGRSRTPPHLRVGNNQIPSSLLVEIDAIHARPTAASKQSRSFKCAEYIFICWKSRRRNRTRQEMKVQTAVGISSFEGTLSQLYLLRVRTKYDVVRAP